MPFATAPLQNARPTLLKRGGQLSIWPCFFAAINQWYSLLIKLHRQTVLDDCQCLYHSKFSSIYAERRSSHSNLHVCELHHVPMISMRTHTNKDTHMKLAQALHYTTTQHNHFLNCVLKRWGKKGSYDPSSPKSSYGHINPQNGSTPNFDWGKEGACLRVGLKCFNLSCLKKRQKVKCSDLTTWKAANHEHMGLVKPEPCGRK
jgi:hypothetical protein